MLSYKLTLEIINKTDNINNQVINRMKDLGYDTTIWENQNYYENPLMNMMWATIHLGLPNIENKIYYRLLQCEILYYSEYLKFHTNDEEVKKYFEL